MPQSDGYNCQKLREGLDALVLHDAPLRDRLEFVGIALMTLGPDDFEAPADQALFEGLITALTHVEPEGEEGSIRATTAAMSEEEAHSTATTFLELYHRFFPFLHE